MKGVAADVDTIQMPHTFLYHDWISVLMFALLAFSLYYFARKPLGRKGPAVTGDRSFRYERVLGREGL